MQLVRTICWVLGLTLLISIGCGVVSVLFWSIR